MNAIALGQQGKLKGEILTVVAFDDLTFSCDNGKKYITSKSEWMTNPTVKKAAKKAKKAVKVLTAVEREEFDLHLAWLKHDGKDTESLMRQDTAYYRAGKSGMSSLTK